MKKNPGFGSLAVRTSSGVVIAAVMVGAILLSPYTLGALMVIICIGCMREFYKIATIAGSQPQKMYGIILGALLVVVNFLFSTDLIERFTATLDLAVLLMLFFVVFLVELYRKRARPLLNIGSTMLGLICVAVPVILLMYIGTYSRWLLLGYVVIIWANDVGAYLLGVTFGKRKLFERISPKKSWEGFFGGLVLAVGVGILIGCLLRPDGSAGGPVFWAGLAVISVIAGVFGDLVESLLKRSVMIKDSGAAIPGHGGFLDRFDALLFSAPFVFVYFLTFNALFSL